MPDYSELQIDRLLGECRDQATARRNNLASGVEAVADLRDCCETLRLLLIEMESSVAVDLELLEVLTSARVGPAWAQPSERVQGGDQ